MIVLNCAQMKQLEQSAVDCGDSYLNLMEQAGCRAAEFIMNKYSNRLNNAVILCGKGNNGGDGFVVARKFCECGVSVIIILADGMPVTTAANAMYSLIQNKVTGILDINDERVPRTVSNADVIVDAIYGIGFQGKLPDRLEPLVNLAASARAKVIALDLPSGVQCDNGAVEGSCVCADDTVSFTALKPAQVLYPAADFCGETVVVTVGISPELINQSPYVMKVTDTAVVRGCIHVRRRSAHKGSFGTLVCVCGSVGMAGAAVLSSSAAVRCGVGLVNVALPKSIYPVVAAHITEPVFTLLAENNAGTLSYSCKAGLLDVIKSAKACLIGCGMGCNEDTKLITAAILQTANVPLIIDADGINAIAEHIDILKTKAEGTSVILTPHPGEMARLLKTTTADVQNNRYQYAKQFAQEYQVVLVLKGANTLIAMPDGEVFVNRTGNPGMARGGSGDVLAGMIASFTAQGIGAQQAALCGVYLHGLAGDYCAERLTELAMTPSDIVQELPALFLEIFKD